jgi:hypothetical protein
MYPSTRGKQKMKIEWVNLKNGSKYFKALEVEGVEYWVPNDERLYVRAVCGECERDTDFYETDAFYPYSDYNFFMLDGVLTDPWA